MSHLYNLGSLCIDNVYRVDAIAGSGETVASQDHQVFPGGKGLNQSLAAARAGAQVFHAGCVGVDGAFLIDVLRDAGVDVRRIQTLPGASGHAVIQVDSEGQNSIVITGGANRNIAPSLVLDVLDAMQPDDWLLLQNEINDVSDVLEQAAARKLQVALNVAPVDGREQAYDLDAVTLLIVNDIEAQALAQCSNPTTAMRLLCGRHPNTHVVLTRGREGLHYAHTASRSQCSIAAFAVDAIDETAAGDAFIGYLLAGVAAGDSMPEALRRGSAAGALAVTRAGAASSIPSREAVAELLNR